jgi:hypothetical protein
MYGMSLRLAPSGDFKGCAAVNFVPDPATFLKDAGSAGIPLVGYIPGIYCVDTGQCCDSNFICVADDLTENECLATPGNRWDGTKTCADDCACASDADCDDGDACTDDTCDIPSGVCSNTENFDPGTECCDPATGDTCLIDDGEFCTADSCSDPDSRGDCVHDPAPQEGEACDDGEPCATVLDECVNGECVGQDILTIPCTDDAECEALTSGIGSCNPTTGFCRCVPPSLNCDIQGYKGDSSCVDEGDKFTVDIYFSDVPVAVAGGQFAVTYDPSCMDFVSISPGGDPYTFEIKEIVDEASGYIFYAVGVDPFGGVGNLGTGVLATISFIKAGECNCCSLDIGGVNPADAVLSDMDGQPVEGLIINECGEVCDNSDAHLDVPDSAEANADCDETTAVVTWDPPTAWSDCYDVDLVCAGSHESGYQYPAVW